MKGTGPGGRITREDVEAAAAAPVSGTTEDIAERMFKSLQSTAQLTLTTEVDVTPGRAA